MAAPEPIPNAPAAPRRATSFPPMTPEPFARGTFGTVHDVPDDPTKVVKVIDTFRHKWRKGGVEYSQFDAYASDKAYFDLLAEVTIQQQLHAMVPGSCPKIYDFIELITARGDYRFKCAIVMEKCEGTAHEWLADNAGNDTEVLDFLEQVATILQKAQAACRFNHRDLKANNIMYKTVDGKKKYLLVDFGFSCATFNNKKYEGTEFFAAGQPCLRPSRDLAFLVYKTYKSFANLSANMKRFFETLLTIEREPCNMVRGYCPPIASPGFTNQIEFEEYRFLNKDGTENVKTTPDGLLQQIKAYREKHRQSPPPVAPWRRAAPASEPAAVPEQGQPATPSFEVSPSPGGKKKRRAYSGGYTRRRAPGARARTKRLRHRRGTRR